MSENVIIKEGGIGRRMPNTSRLVTSDGSNTDYWVPLSDRLTATKYISKNGEYEAEKEGLHSWSKIHVGIYGGAAGLTIPTSTDPYSGIEIPTGADGVIDPVAPAGLEPLEPIDELDIEDILDIDDIEEIDLTDPTTIEDLSPTITPTDSVISGIDPISGNESTVDGHGTEENKPSGISIIVPPSKTVYRDGEQIDISGMMVKLIDNNGNTFHDNRYTDGIIPNTELSIEPTTAETSQNERTNSYNGETVRYVLTQSIQWHTIAPNRHQTRGAASYYGRAVIVKYSRLKGHNVIYASTHSDESGYSIIVKRYNASNEYTSETTSSGFGRNTYTKNNKTIYWGSLRYGYDAEEVSPLVEGDASGLSDEERLWIAIYGNNESVENVVTVSWSSPYDNETYSASFSILVRV